MSSPIGRAGTAGPLRSPSRARPVAAGGSGPAANTSRSMPWSSARSSAPVNRARDSSPPRCRSNEQGPGLTAAVRLAVVEHGSRHRLVSWFDWFFRNRQTGRITIAQFPNFALWSYLVTVVVRRFVSAGTPARTVLDAIGVAALAGWALDEVLRGVNPWR